MSAMAGDNENFEEASRALFAGDRPTFERLDRQWPKDVLAHIHKLENPATHIDLCITKGAKADDVEIRRAKGPASRLLEEGTDPARCRSPVRRDDDGPDARVLGPCAGRPTTRGDPELAKAAGHASASRARVPVNSIVELLQAERLVECFEAELWGGASDGDTRCAVWRRRRVRPLRADGSQ